MRSITLRRHDKLTTNICFRVTDEQYIFLENISKTYHCTIPQILRIIIEHEKQKTEGE